MGYMALLYLKKMRHLLYGFLYLFTYIYSKIAKMDKQYIPVDWCVIKAVTPNMTGFLHGKKNNYDFKMLPEQGISKFRNADEALAFMHDEKLEQKYNAMFSIVSGAELLQIPQRLTPEEKEVLEAKGLVFVCTDHFNQRFLLAYSGNNYYYTTSHQGAALFDMDGAKELIEEIKKRGGKNFFPGYPETSKSILA